MQLGSLIPNFEADTTDGPIVFYNWQGSSWVLLFSHPADFTPVCTSELAQIAIDLAKFTKRNVKCLGHSTDHLSSHFIWINDLQSYCEHIIGQFPYPIIADPQLDLAVKFGMLDEEEKQDPEIGYITYTTVRALFIIDPNHRLRLSMFYPMSTGRNIEEILRVIDSLQLTDRLEGVVTPANWTPGSKLMISPSVSDEDAEKRFPKGIEKVEVPSGKDYIRTTFE